MNTVKVSMYISLPWTEPANTPTPVYARSLCLQKGIQTRCGGLSAPVSFVQAAPACRQLCWISIALPNAGVDSPAREAGLTSSAIDPSRPKLLTRENLETQLSSGLAISFIRWCKPALEAIAIALLLFHCCHL